MNTFDPELIAILACPVCRGAVEALPAEGEVQIPGLHCAKCAVVYPVQGGIPVMLKEDSVPYALWQTGTRKASKKA